MPSELSLPITSCIKNSSLNDSDQRACFLVAAKHFSNYHLVSLGSQGGCSLSLKAIPRGTAKGTRSRRDSVLAAASTSTTHHYDGDEAETLLLQFRPLKFAIPLAIAFQVDTLYPTLCPKTHSLNIVTLDSGSDVQLASMSFMHGQRFSDLQPRTRCLDADSLARMETLLGTFSSFFTRQWETGKPHKFSSLEKCHGKIGSTIVSRLELLARSLPTQELRERARKTKTLVWQGLLDGLPVVLTHGDLLPSNIIVDPDTWRVEGYVDWAEAEWLPFGMALYGLEHLLGYLERDTGSGRVEFVYYEQAGRLREVFSRGLEERVERLREVEVRRAVKVCRDVGILLWRGIAWDDGAVDRAVAPDRDGDELACLQSFLNVLKD